MSNHLPLETIVEDTLVPHQAFNSATSRLNQCFTYSTSKREPICLAIVGESRTGKSRLLEEFIDKHPMSRDEDGMNIPILKVTAPSKPTVKSLAEIMLEAMLDELPGTGSEAQKTRRLARLMKECGTLMIVIDEFQHFVDKASDRVIHDAADWLKSLVDGTRCVLVVAGLPSSVGILTQNEQFKGRFYAPVHMPRFDWAIDKHRDEFIAILGAFHESMSRYFNLPQLDNSEMAFRCYCGTGGLIGYLTKFLRQVVWNAIDSNKQAITLADFAIAQEQAIYQEENCTDIVNPFSRSFRPFPNEILLTQAHSIGKAVELPPKPRQRGPRSSKRMSSRDALSAS
ncbi:DNA transposition protein, AAA+ family ATPase [Paraburkholderia fungorum]|uniref:DNA transposition protein, AAA+ family ATPase n=1 Tax=Paraburkholderia fungorum TaxID=134537 RepID=A0A1H1HR03_9BURK|nr:TniB family NTP-binding protein [Paraburkholderia fungorum]SDR27817.1 DNA transposition protein, AAA+ family ATPase [Paraburkholderia fungorum]